MSFTPSLLCTHHMYYYYILWDQVRVCLSIMRSTYLESIYWWSGWRSRQIALVVYKYIIMHWLVWGSGAPAPSPTLNSSYLTHHPMSKTLTKSHQRNNIDFFNPKVQQAATILLPLGDLVGMLACCVHILQYMQRTPLAWDSDSYIHPRVGYQ